jgi:tetratricopeptide (TPR) repeat protein
MGIIDKALEHARIGAELAESVHAIECACAGFYEVAKGKLERKELEEAVKEFDKSLSFADVAGWEGYVNRIQSGRARAVFEQGSPEAVADLETALRNAHSVQDDYAAALISEQLAAALVHLSRLDEAQQHLDAALEYYRRTETRPYVARALDLAARLYDRQGRAADASAARTEAEALRQSFRAAPASPPPQPVPAP